MRCQLVHYDQKTQEICRQTHTEFIHFHLHQSKHEKSQTSIKAWEKSDINQSMRKVRQGHHAWTKSQCRLTVTLNECFMNYFWAQIKIKISFSLVLNSFWIKKMITSDRVLVRLKCLRNWQNLYLLSGVSVVQSGVSLFSRSSSVKKGKTAVLNLGPLLTGLWERHMRNADVKIKFEYTEQHKTSSITFYRLS